MNTRNWNIASSWHTILPLIYSYLVYLIRTSLTSWTNRRIRPQPYHAHHTLTFVYDLNPGPFFFWPEQDGNAFITCASNCPHRVWTHQSEKSSEKRIKLWKGKQICTRMDTKTGGKIKGGDKSGKRGSQPIEKSILFFNLISPLKKRHSSHAALQRRIDNNSKSQSHHL